MEKRRASTEDRENSLSLKTCLIVLSGLPLSGKSLVADKLVNSTNLELVDVDEVRNRIDKTRGAKGLIRLLESDKEKEIMINSYTLMCRQAAEKIGQGIPIVITGTFSREEFKKPLTVLVRQIKSAQIPLKIFLLIATDEEVERRIEKRREGGGLSNIDTLEKYKWAKGLFSKIGFAPVIEIDTENPAFIDKIIGNLKELKK
jgi:predicted kinase